MQAYQGLVRSACSRAQSTCSKTSTAENAVRSRRVRSVAHSIDSSYNIDSNSALSVLLVNDAEGLPGKICPAHESTTSFAAALRFAISDRLWYFILSCNCKLESACVPGFGVCYTFAKLFQYLLLQIVVWELRPVMMSLAS